MERYKFANKEETVVNNKTTGQCGINKRVWLWRKYQEWIAEGGITEPFKTEEELDKDQAEQTRLHEFESEKVASGLRDISVTEARLWIKSQINLAKDFEELKSVNIKIWNKVLPHILS